MKKQIISFMLVTSIAMVLSQETRSEEFTRVFTPFDSVAFYDGYNETIVDADLDDGILRHRNSLYAKKLTDTQLEWFGEELDLKITIGALCDNYDRIGNLNLSLVPKGETSYDPFKVDRIELARFITPFMDKNKWPDEVSYKYDITSASYIFRDKTLRDKYDYWLEFEVFGIPYAANTQILGCRDRNDVFNGTVEFISSETAAEATDNHVFVPIVMKKPEYISSNLNNYNENGTDTIGKCTKTYKFNVPQKVSDSQIVLITSNHGANAYGEEYNRRLHLVYLNGELITTYTPGGVSCEPFRYLNTQTNGIYGNSRSEVSWRNQSNWCPGDLIPIRYLNLGELEAGDYEIMIRVPDAVFPESQGDIPVSMYFQGFKEGNLPVEVESVEIDDSKTRVYQRGNNVYIDSPNTVTEISIYTYDGKFVYGSHNSINNVDLNEFEQGIYLVNFMTDDGMITTYKAIRK